MPINDKGSIENKVYRFIRDNKVLTPELITELETMGMIPRDQLKDGSYYYGVCRNTRIAQWRDKPTYPSKTELPNQVKEPCFFHMRLKFNKIFVETIKHPVDEAHFDAFIPLREINQTREF